MKATMFHLGAFGIQTTLVKIERIEVPRVRFIEKGKRTPKAANVSTGKVFFVDGWNATDLTPPATMEDLGNGCERTKYGCFDKRYEEEFTAFRDSVPASRVVRLT